MSSILKALQRLQGDRGAAGSPEPKPALQDQLARELTRTPPVPPSANPPAEHEASPSRARLAILAVPVGVALVAIAVTGFWLANRADEPALTTALATPPAPVATPPPTVSPAPTVAAAPKPSAAPPLPATPPVERAVPPLPPQSRARAADVEMDRERPSAATEAAPSRAPRTSEVPRFEVVADATSGAPAPEPRNASPEARPGAVPANPPAERSAPEGTSRPAVPGADVAQEAPRPDAGDVRPAAAPPKQKPRAASAPGTLPEIEVLRTTWHPHPERRIARLRVAGLAEPIEVHEGDAVSTLVVKTIEPSGVLLLHGSDEVRRNVGGKP